MEFSSSRKQDQPALIARLIRALLRGRVREAHLILRGSPQIPMLSPGLAALCGSVEGLGQWRSSDPPSLFAVDPLLELTPLFAAALSRAHLLSRNHAERQLACLDLLLDAGAAAQSNRYVNQDVLGRHESLLAASISGAGYLPLTRRLLERGANCQEPDALVAAVRHGSAEPFDLLLEKGARAVGSQALCAALEREEPTRIQRLLKAGADPSCADGQGQLPLLVALAEERSAAVLELLLSAGADPNVRNDDGLSAFRLAHRQGLIAQADLLLARGAGTQLERVDSLFGYCSRGMTDMALEVLSSAPELFDRACDPSERLLVDAVRLGKQRAVATMLEVGFSVLAAPAGEQPLHVAARYGRERLVRPLIDAEAPLRARDLYDRTPLAVAVRACGDPPIGAGDCIATVRALLEAGAWPEAWMLRTADEELAEVLERYLAA